jgi:aromatic ring-opening dioxygenase LigB subunit
MATANDHGAVSHEEQRKLANDLERLFRPLRAALDEARPDALVVVANDQFVNFFFDNIPTFCLGVGDATEGKFTHHHFRYPIAAELARALLNGLIADGFDMAFSQQLMLEHTQVVPLHFLLGESSLPIVPLFVNTWVEPVPSPRRCHQLGQALARALELRPERVALLATGGLSHFPGSPRIGEVEESFDGMLLEHLREGRGSELADLELAQLREAGNTEFLNWMVLLGAIGTAPAEVGYRPDGVATGLGFATFHLTPSAVAGR